MGNEDSNLAKALIQTLVALIAPGAPAGPLIGVTFDKLLTQPTGSAQQISKVLSEKGREISASLVAAERAGLTNPGSGYSAVIDLTGILGRVSISPQLLIELGLDTDLLWKHLLKIAAPNLEEASPGRRGQLESALHEIAETVMLLSPDLSAVRLEFMRQVLRRIPRSSGTEA